jgi:hypothetical protein
VQGERHGRRGRERPDAIDIEDDGRTRARPWMFPLDGAKQSMPVASMNLRLSSNDAAGARPADAPGSMPPIDSSSPSTAAPTECARPTTA